MELQLIRREYNLYETAINTKLWVEQNADAVVPDSLPDILRIVDTASVVEVREKELRGDKLYIAGEIRTNVIFVPETGNGVCSVSVSLPFHETVELPPGLAAPVAFVRVGSRRADARELNPRKIALKATVGLLLAILVPRVLRLPGELCGDIACEALSMPFASRAVVGAREKSIALSDTLDIDDDIADNRVIRTELEVVCNDYKVIPDKVVIKAAARLKLTWLTGDDDRPVRSHEYEMPFSSVIDCDGVDEDAECDLYFLTTGCKWSISDSAGERRSLSVNIGLEVQATAFKTVQGEYLTDAYSISHDIALEHETVTIPRNSETKTLRIPVREIIEPGMTPAKLYSVSVYPSNPSRLRDDGGVSADCEVRVVFEADDGGVYSVSRSIIAQTELSADDGDFVFTAADAADADGHINQTGGIEIKFTALLTGETYTGDSREVLAAVSPGEKKALPANRPSITLRYALPGESFWNIAKTYNTTVEDIRRSNGLEGESTPTAGKILLIPRH